MSLVPIILRKDNSYSLGIIDLKDKSGYYLKRLYWGYSYVIDDVVTNDIFVPEYTVCIYFNIPISLVNIDSQYTIILRYLNLDTHISINLPKPGLLNILYLYLDYSLTINTGYYPCDMPLDMFVWDSNLTEFRGLEELLLDVFHPFQRVVE